MLSCYEIEARKDSSGSTVDLAKTEMEKYSFLAQISIKKKETIKKHETQVALLILL